MARATPINKKCPKCVTRKKYQEFFRANKKGTQLRYMRICNDCANGKFWWDEK